MTADTIATAIIVVGLFAFGAAHVVRCYRTKIEQIESANTELRDRLATVTGQLADERARYALRVNRAHDGACKAARTRKAMRIKLPEVTP